MSKNASSTLKKRKDDEGAVQRNKYHGTWQVLSYETKQWSQASPGPVNDKKGARDAFDPVDVGEHIPGHGEPEVKGHSEGRSQRTLKHNASQLYAFAGKFLGQLARWPAA